METWIALFRGINVGGKNILKMAELRSELETLKFKNVRTYIQSGNVIFDSKAKYAAMLAKKIAKNVEDRHGFRPRVFVLSRTDLETAIESNPFPKAISDPKTLHFYFLEEPATQPNVAALDDAKASTENYKLTSSVFYLHAPEGIARSKLAASAEKHLGVAATARNYRTVEKVLAMLDSN